MSCAIPIRSWCRRGLCALACVALQITTFAATDSPPRKSPGSSSASTRSATRSSVHKSKKSKSKRGKKRGQQVIDSERSREIQEALIREHYMEGKPSGKWDAATQDALRRYQADQGWQAKTVPDSRALIKLGLGPSHDHLLNPESAMTTGPLPPNAKPDSKGPDSPATTRVQTPATEGTPQR